MNDNLTYGEFVEALRSAPKSKIDNRIKGIGSWRGIYSDIAVFTEETGYRAMSADFDPDFYYLNCEDREKAFSKWENECLYESDHLPTTAGELADVLEFLLYSDLMFEGYKGGLFPIDRNRPLWLEESSYTYSNNAIIGITDDLKLITKII